MNFTSRERRGAIAFVVVVILLTVLLSNGIFHHNQNDWHVVKDTAQVNAWLQSVMAQQIIRPHKFDPNNSSVEELTQMGISSAMAVSWIKYTDAGGYFNQPQDLLRLYGMSDSVYSVLRPFISIKSRKPTFTQQNRFEKRKKNTDIFEPFNPASDTEKQLIDAGLPGYVASSIMKYRQAGGSFVEKADLLKIYVIDSALYLKLEPHIQLDESPFQSVISLDSVELNSATFHELRKLQFAESFIGRVLKYRDLLGGYYSFDQLNEVYQAKEYEVNKLKSACWIDTLQVVKVQINEVTQTQMGMHPYISYKKASKIIKYRSFAGRIENFREYSSLKLHTEDEMEKLKPYLSFK